jgi:hypothetical protein
MSNSVKLMEGMELLHLDKGMCVVCTQKEKSGHKFDDLTPEMDRWVTAELLDEVMVKPEGHLLLCIECLWKLKPVSSKKTLGENT